MLVPNGEVEPGLDSLVCMTARSSGRTPFFCVHGRSGNIDNFRPLADRLGPAQPFYALQARGLHGEHSPHATIEDAAREYVSAIETICPDGPYILGGYSGGGVIAYEMAQQILRSGRQVELIIMFDSVEPREMCRPMSIRDRLLLLPQVHLRILLEWPINRFRDLQFALYKSRLTASTQTAQDAVGEAYLRAQSAYFPQPYGGDLYIVRAHRARAYHLRGGPLLGWQRLVSGTIEVCDVDCTHLTMFEEPAVSRVAQALLKKLDSRSHRGCR
jgi:thioesterase domain-containing protein